MSCIYVYDGTVEITIKDSDFVLDNNKQKEATHFFEKASLF